MTKTVKFRSGKNNITIFEPPSLNTETDFYDKTEYLYNDILDLKVPDVVRYQFEFLNDNLTTVEWSLHPIDSKETDVFIEQSTFNDVDCSKLVFDQNISRIILLLESPHNEEYNYYDENGELVEIKKRTSDKFNKVKNIKRIKPIAPAQGDTGKMIHRWLITILSNINEFKDRGRYEILIANPIQCQASLHCIHGQSPGEKAYGDLKEDVWTKLWSIGNNQSDFSSRLESYTPFLVINACTKNLQKVVTSHLLKLDFIKKIYETPHPSSWFSHKNRYIKKIK